MGNFEVGDVVYLKSDKAKKCLMSVFEIKEVKPEPFFNYVSGEFETRDFKPYTLVWVTWLNSQHAVCEKGFAPEILEKIS